MGGIGIETHWVPSMNSDPHKVLTKTTPDQISTFSFESSLNKMLYLLAFKKMKLNSNWVPRNATHPKDTPLCRRSRLHKTGLRCSTSAAAVKCLSQRSDCREWREGGKKSKKKIFAFTVTNAMVPECIAKGWRALARVVDAAWWNRWSVMWREKKRKEEEEQTKTKTKCRILGKHSKRFLLAGSSHWQSTPLLPAHKRRCSLRALCIMDMDFTVANEGQTILQPNVPL